MKDFNKNKIINEQLNNALPKPGKTGLDWFLFCYFANLYANQPMLEIGAGVGGSLCSLLAFTDDLTLIDSWNQNWPKSTVSRLKSTLRAVPLRQNWKSMQICLLPRLTVLAKLQSWPKAACRRSQRCPNLDE